MLSMAQRGAKDNEIALALGLSRERVGQIMRPLRAAGLAPPSVRGIRPHPKSGLVLQLWAQGLSQKKIATETGMTVKAIQSRIAYARVRGRIEETVTRRIVGGAK